jgi:hypothetical protein
MPPVAESVELKRTPTFAVKAVVVMAGAAGTLIVALADLVLSATEVAVTVAMIAELVAVGAV